MNHFLRNINFLYLEQTICCAVCLSMFLVLNPEKSPGQNIEQIDRENPVSIHGNLSANLMSYSVSGIDPRREAFSWTAYGNATLSLYGVTFPFSAVVSEQHRNFRQPFNQYGVSPNYRWATLHLGYRSLSFSRYTLGGAVFLGAGAELNPGILRFAVMTGRFRKAIEPDSALEPDPLRRVIPSYKRTGYGVKLGLGSESNHVDLILFRASDDTLSVNNPIEDPGILPTENLVLGLNTKFSFGRYLSFDGEAAVSAFTRNLRSQELEFQEHPVLQVMNSFFTPRVSSQANTALQTGMNLSISDFQLRLQYKRIDPDYRTLGSYFFTGDIENITVSPSFHLFDGKLRVRLSGGFQRDNLANKKLATTERTIASVNTDWTPAEIFSISASYSNYGTGQKPGLLDQLSDSVRVSNVTQNITLRPRITLRREAAIHSVMFMVSSQQFADRNPFTSAFTETSSFTIAPSYSLNLLNRRLTITGSVNITQTTTSVSEMRMVGIHGGFSKPLFDGSLPVNISLRYSTTTRDGNTLQGTLTVTSGLTYRFTNQDSLSLNFANTNNNAMSTAGRSFNEFNTRLTYSRRFSI